MATVISVENVSKAYRLGLIDARTLSNEIRVALARMRGKPNPLLKVDQEHLANRDGEIIWALRNVSFNVEQGEALGIIGRNGSGKSTLLKILSRVTAPTEGQARIKGRIASLLEVGTGFHPDLTGRDNIYLNGAILGMTRDEVRRKFDEIVDFSGVEQFIDTPVKRYSSGMYVRLAFAVAAHLEPEILLVDEVLAVGDAAFQKKCLGKMGEVASEGRTILFVSHNMTAIQALCRRSMYIAEGHILDDGITTDIIDRYLRDSEKTNTEKVDAREDRKGRGNVRLIDAFVSIDGIHPVETLMTGQPAYFVFRATPPKAGLDCRFTILDIRRNAVVHFNSAVVAAEDQLTDQERSVFICKVDNLLLSPGKFSINILLTDKLGVQDHVENVLSFLVEAGQSNGRQISRESGYGLVNFPHQWTVKE